MKEEEGEVREEMKGRIEIEENWEEDGDLKVGVIEEDERRIEEKINGEMFKMLERMRNDEYEGRKGKSKRKIWSKEMIEERRKKIEIKMKEIEKKVRKKRLIIGLRKWKWWKRSVLGWFEDEGIENGKRRWRFKRWDMDRIVKWEDKEEDEEWIEECIGKREEKIKEIEIEEGNNEEEKIKRIGRRRGIWKESLMKRIEGIKSLEIRKFKVIIEKDLRSEEKDEKEIEGFKWWKLELRFKWWWVRRLDNEWSRGIKNGDLIEGWRIDKGKRIERIVLKEWEENEVRGFGLWFNCCLIV